MRGSRLARWQYLFWTLNGGGAVTILAACLFAWLHRSRWSFRNSDSTYDFWVSFGFEWFMFWWAFLLGASIASFLNVVAYRVPRGLSLYGSSFCPYCATPISIRDNVPVFGWLMLGGRCRSCRLPISTRYPINEAIGGMIALLIYVATIMEHGWNLPGRFERNAAFGISVDFINLNQTLVFLAIIQATVVLLLFAARLLAANQGRMPIVVWYVAIVILSCVYAVWPSLWVVQFDSSTGDSWFSLSPPSSLESLVSMFIGAMIGGIVGQVANKSFAKAERASAVRWGDGFFGWLLVGGTFGWQFVAVLSLVAALVVLTPWKQLATSRFWLWLLLTLMSWRAWHVGLEAWGRFYSLVGYGLMIAFSLIIFCRVTAAKEEPPIVEA